MKQKLLSEDLEGDERTNHLLVGLLLGVELHFAFLQIASPGF